MYKAYGPERDLSALELLKVSSIEITCKREAFRKAPLRFPEWLGIGTELPGGEENLFLKGARSAGCRVRHLPVVGCRHPVLAGDIRSIWMRPNRMYAMGLVARAYGGTGVLLCVRWSLRAARLKVAWGTIGQLWRGYVRGYPGKPSKQ